MNTSIMQLRNTESVAFASVCDLESWPAAELKRHHLADASTLYVRPATAFETDAPVLPTGLHIPLLFTTLAALNTREIAVAGVSAETLMAMRRTPADLVDPAAPGQMALFASAA